MKKLILALILLAVFAMTGFGQFERGFSNGYFYSEARPNIRLKIDPSLKYLGETSRLEGKIKSEAHMWLTPEPSGPGMDKMFIAELSTISQDRAYETPSSLFRGLKGFAKGKSEIGGESYQYVFYITEPKGDNFWTEYIRKKGFILNQPKLTACFGKISTDTSWTKFYYMKSYDPQKNFRTSLTDEDRAIMKAFIEEFKHDVQYRGKYK